MITCHKNSTTKHTIILFFLTIALSTYLQSQTFTLKQIMSAPFPSSLVTSPSGDRVAWVFNDQGRRNIYVADAPDYKAIKITHYDRDDGQELGNLEFTPDGVTIVYVRGGSSNRQGEYPNPTSDTKGAYQAVWAVNTTGGEPWMLGKGSNPTVSPKGNWVIFTRGNNLYKTTIDSVNKSTQLFHARGRNRNPVWSPDGTKLAFVSSRDDHSYIGIYHFQDKRITWMSPGVDRDNHPAWAPDGKNIAFIRIPGILVEPQQRRETGLPFALWVADAETGEGQCVWTSPDSSAGFAQYYPAHALMWGADNVLIFYSEHDGWMHLYSVSINEGRAVCLTPGDYEVEECTLSPDRKIVVFNSNRGDIDRRHLWSVGIKDGKLRPLTQGKGLEWRPTFGSDNGDLFFLCSTYSQPSAPAVTRLGSKKHSLIAPETIPEDFPSDKLVEPRQVIIPAPDGLEIHGQLFVPKESKPGDERPAVIFMHGGPIRQMMLGFHMRGYYHNCYAMNQYLTSRGYVVLSVNFRSGIGYGRAFRIAPNQGPRGASEYQDIVAAARFLQKRPEVDPEKIGLWGGSYGGYLTALGLARDSELFAAGVDLHGVHDWSLRGRRRNGGGWGIQGEETMRLAWESSPVADVQFWYSPVLFIHGDDDRNVDFIQTTDLVQRLRREGKAHVEMLIFPDEVHGFLRHDRWLQAYEAAADFFDRFLMKK